MIMVVAAVIEADSRVLICQRRKDDKFPLLWEFPGGKVEPGETPEEALARELQEELGVRAEIGGELYRTRHSYKELADGIELIFFSAVIGATPGNFVYEAFEQIAWAKRDELGNFQFLPADRGLVELLQRGDTHKK